jgi:Zn finger protein HypA/HybF involved in hydrogenase expression
MKGTLMDKEKQQISDEDWTKNCNSSNVDIPAFVAKMQDMKAGKDVDWQCPFCGGKVVLYQNDNGHTEIGCVDCDMRINLESN